MFRCVHVINVVVDGHKVLHILNVLSAALVIQHAKRMHHTMSSVA